MDPRSVGAMPSRNDSIGIRSTTDEPGVARATTLLRTANQAKYGSPLFSVEWNAEGTHCENIRPYPDPLPRGEGTSSGCAPWLQSGCGPSNRRGLRETVEPSPSPGGEGQGEGGPPSVIPYTSPSIVPPKTARNPKYADKTARNMFAWSAVLQASFVRSRWIPRRRNKHPRDCSTDRTAWRESGAGATKAATGFRKMNVFSPLEQVNKGCNRERRKMRENRFCSLVRVFRVVRGDPLWLRRKPR